MNMIMNKKCISYFDIETNIYCQKASLYDIITEIIRVWTI